MRKRAIPLSQAPVEEHVTIVALRGGSEFQQRVSGLGLRVGSTCEVLMSSGAGRMLVAVGDTRVALGHGMAEKVMIRAPED